MKWIKYKIVCNTVGEEVILLDKKVGYSEINLSIAKEEAYNNEYTIEDDTETYDKEPLEIKYGGTGANNAKDACKNIEAVPTPKNHYLKDGFVYLNESGATRFVNKLFKYSIIVDNGKVDDPAAIEYADDCSDFEPMTMSTNGILYEGGWANNVLLDMFKPCVIAPDSDEPTYYLNKNNLSQKEDGTPAVLTGEDGDVMVEVSGPLYGKIVNFGSKVKISIMNYRESDSFCFHDIGGVIKPKIYRGRYKASVTADDENVLRSISGIAPLVNVTRAQCRERAINRGNGYHQNNIYMLFLWQAMYLLLFKNRNSQAVLGRGYTAKSNTGILNCGSTDSKPWIFGNQTQTDSVVFLGVEDFYGNVWEWVDGIVVDNLVYKLTRDPSKYNDTGDGFEISTASGLVNKNDSNKFLMSIQGTNALAFLPAGAGGTSSTYFCDMIWIEDDSIRVAQFGYIYFGYLYAGAFCWAFDCAANYVDESSGSRLCRA